MVVVPINSYPNLNKFRLKLPSDFVSFILLQRNYISVLVIVVARLIGRGGGGLYIYDAVTE